VEVDPAGGGAAVTAERQPGAKHCAGGRRAEQITCPRKKKRGRGSGGSCLKISEILGTSW
jgi:hypothetical protein